VDSEGIIILPGAYRDDVESEGEVLSMNDGIWSVEATADGISIEVGAGSYRFEYPPDR
jgi:alpha-L-rhamnosidase